MNLKRVYFNPQACSDPTIMIQQIGDRRSTVLKIYGSTETSTIIRYVDKKPCDYLDKPLFFLFLFSFFVFLQDMLWFSSKIRSLQKLCISFYNRFPRFLFGFCSIHSCNHFIYSNGSLDYNSLEVCT